METNTSLCDDFTQHAIRLRKELRPSQTNEVQTENYSNIRCNGNDSCRHPANSENDATPILNTCHRKCTSPPSRRVVGRDMFGFDAEEEKALSPTTTTVEIELLHTSSWKNAKDASTTLCSTTLRAKLAADNTKKFKKS